MGELMGIGMTHAPQFQYPDEHMADIHRMRLKNEKTPAAMRDPRNWPAAMQAQWGREAGNHLARQLILSGFDVAYAYKFHHAEVLNHAFVRTVLYLDYDQQGFPYPVIPFHVNCYGSDLMAPEFISEGRTVDERDDRHQPPPAPPPWR